MSDTKVAQCTHTTLRNTDTPLSFASDKTFLPRHDSEKNICEQNHDLIYNGNDQSNNPNSSSPSTTLNAWMTVVGAFVSLFCTFGQINSFGTFQSWYAAHQLQHLPPSTIAWIGSLQLWVFFFSGSFIGRAFDSYGPSRIMALGTVISAFSIMMTSISTRYYQYILSQGLLFGLGVGLMFYPAMAAVSTHFSKYRATALGIAAAGSSLGGVAYPIMLQQLFGRVGFGWAVRTSGFMSLGLCSLSILAVRSRQHPQKNAEITEQPWISFKPFRDPRFNFLAAGSFLVCLGIYIPFFYLPSYTHSITPSLAPYVLATLNAGGILGRVAPALLADTLGRFNTLAPTALLAGVLCLALWLVVHSAGAILVFAALYGVFSGAFIALVPPCVVQIAEDGETGAWLGMLYTVISLPSLFGGPVAGALLVRDHGVYTSAIVFAGATIISGSVLLWVARMKVESTILVRI